MGLKKGFTMIELIFVIVILGILASVAIPRLAVSRDDAQIVKLRADVQAIQTGIALQKGINLMSGNIAAPTIKAGFGNVLEGKSLTAAPNGIGWKKVPTADTNGDENRSTIATACIKKNQCADFYYDKDGTFSCDNTNKICAIIIGN
ncbi:type II secretion system protein [uncultured Campylobacter sp.]|uniref:type II secretion system protein n=1 Tax=uncultured Campylobacter sp. TaxID=218934 RepID=UPI00262992EF|nr:prepilin-type N-terminal cleavage/methylation domain-containing protein [uncultured Campylobacter sp.]